MSAPTARPGLTHEAIEETGELIVVDPATEKATVLNATAAEIWLLCDGERRPEDIAAELAEVLGDGAPPAGRLLEDVKMCLTELQKEGLLTA